MFEGKRFFPDTGTPIWKIARRSVVLAVWLPEPLTVATWIEKSLCWGFKRFLSFGFERICFPEPAILSLDARRVKAVSLDPLYVPTNNRSMPLRTIPEPYLALDEATLAS